MFNSDWTNVKKYVRNHIGTGILNHQRKIQHFYCLGRPANFKFKFKKFKNVHVEFATRIDVLIVLLCLTCVLIMAAPWCLFYFLERGYEEANFNKDFSETSCKIENSWKNQYVCCSINCASMI